MRYAQRTRVADLKENVQEASQPCFGDSRLGARNAVNLGNSTQDATESNRIEIFCPFKTATLAVPRLRSLNRRGAAARQLPKTGQLPPGSLGEAYGMGSYSVFTDSVIPNTSTYRDAIALKSDRRPPLLRAIDPPAAQTDTEDTIDCAARYHDWCWTITQLPGES